MHIKCVQFFWHICPSIFLAVVVFRKPCKTPTIFGTVLEIRYQSQIDANRDIPSSGWYDNGTQCSTVWPVLSCLSWHLLWVKLSLFGEGKEGSAHTKWSPCFCYLSAKTWSCFLSMCFAWLSVCLRLFICLFGHSYSVGLSDTLMGI